MEQSDEIKVEELHPLLQESVEEPKVLKKFKSLAEKLVKRVNGRIDAERDVLRSKLSIAQTAIQTNVDDFIKNTNKDLEKFKKRYDAMYSDLVRRILFKMEQRVFSAELFEQATLDLMVEKIYRIEKGLKPEDEVEMLDQQAYIEDCAKLHEQFMQKHADNFAKKQKEERDAAIQQEQEADKVENSGGKKDESSSEADTKDGGTTNPEDGKQAEPTPSPAES